MRLAPQELRTYFVTTVAANRRRLFQVTETADLMCNVLAHYRLQSRFEIHAFVVMPDHVHLLITPAPDISLEKAMQFIKGGFSFRLKSKRQVWERGFNEVQIRTSSKFDAYKRYIEENPVQARLAASAEEYPFCSARRGSEVDAMPQHFFRAEIRG